MERTITVEGNVYELVVVQRAESGVYRGAHGYLRLGEPERISRLAAHQRMLGAADFPVARIISEGYYAGHRYLLEESLGEKRLGIVFREEWGRGAVSEASFDAFLSVVIRFTEVQLRAGALLGETQLSAGIRLPSLLNSMRADAARIEAAFGRIMRKLSVLPAVACHGDFNPQNLFPSGVIDLEDVFPGPAGYDQISALTTTELNPEGSEQYEFPARYRFSEDQKTMYMASMDALFVAAGLQPLSAYAHELATCRAFWAASDMDAWPKTRAWREDRVRALVDATLQA